MASRVDALLDGNESGALAAADAQLVINVALGVLQLPAADLDDDTRMTAADVQLVIVFDLGLAPSQP